MTRVYLAASYSRRVELLQYRQDLELLGYTVTSRWLNGTHQIADDGRPIGEAGELLVEGTSVETPAVELRRHFLREDMEDVAACDILVSFTEPPRSEHSRGGRHVEHGMALAFRKYLVIVGPRENLFHWHPNTVQFDTWDEALAAFETRPAPKGAQHASANR